MRKIIVGLAVLVLSLGGLASCFQGPLAVRVMGNALEKNLVADSVAEFPDGLHVMLCGAGGPLPDPNRSAPCTVVVAGDSVFLVDAGSSAARNLPKVGVAPPRIDAVLLTHFHSDHIDGLGELGMLRWTAGSKSSPLPLYGPEGVERIVDGLREAYHFDSVYRTAHHGPETVPPTGSGYRAMSFPEPPAGESTIVLDDRGVRITMFKVDHPPVSPAVGYRFEYKGRSVVVSGDTSKSANLERFAQGVDLLVHEALSPELMNVIGTAASNVGNETMTKIAVDVLDYHATPVEAAETAETVGAGHLLYYHVVPPLPVPGLASVYLKGVRDAYSGPVTLGQDGTTISLPAGSEKIIVVKK
ncbi:MAG: MBL fold metallo-hydrolase [Myxococcota bacterium]